MHAYRCPWSRSKKQKLRTLSSFRELPRLCYVFGASVLSDVLVLLARDACCRCAKQSVQYACCAYMAVSVVSGPSLAVVVHIAQPL
ncbi:hypothetical protein JVT61DRAFT_6512 [Boletus reticuloceps]|uniref:Uncharacterized protein n=1 Tax=Boletus reticuloceps TaxID=495285 RepID=A0A8I2YK57_9AGAM|nr:hypothetical protein JVT61DRAFT_6512 [Boletus reticuloceps]